MYNVVSEIINWIINSENLTIAVFGVLHTVDEKFDLLMLITFDV
jgi:hypothetical protein